MVSAFLLATISDVTVPSSAVVTAALTYILTKRREREADWRNVKLELYREYVTAVAGVVEGRMTAESEIRYHDAYNVIRLVASPDVRNAMRAYQLEISPMNMTRTWARHNQKLTDVGSALREDLDPRRTRKNETLTFHLISACPWSEPAAPTSK